MLVIQVSLPNQGTPLPLLVPSSRLSFWVLLVLFVGGKEEGATDGDGYGFGERVEGGGSVDMELRENGSSGERESHS